MCVCVWMYMITYKMFNYASIYVIKERIWVCVKAYIYIILYPDSILYIYISPMEFQMKFTGTFAW